MREGNVSIEVLVNDKAVNEYKDTHKALSGGTYIAGDIGKEFTIRVRNHVPDRILAVVSVDGLSVMTGDKASVNGPGYVISGHGYVDIPGWRRSDSEIAKFAFTDPETSYSTKMNKGAESIGVIGVAAFSEKRPKAFLDRINTSLPRRKFDHSLPGSKISTRSLAAPSVGTGYGDAAEHNVQTVEFERASSTPDRVISLFYETDARLKELGIMQEEDKHVPQAFPGFEEAQTPAPPGWKPRQQNL